MKVQKEYDAADGSATPGEVFTASIGNRSIIPAGKELSYMRMGLKGAVATSAVVIEDFGDLLSEYVLFVGSETRLKLDSQDLCALHKFYYGGFLHIGENTDATGNDYIGGVKIPVYAPADPAKPFTHAATRTAVTNIATETIALSTYWDMEEVGRKAIHAVKLTHTTAGGAGFEQLNFGIPRVGKLIGLIFEIPNGFDDTNIDTSIQRFRILVEGVEHSQFNILSDGVPLNDQNYVAPAPHGDLLRPYLAFDFRPAGYDAKANRLTLAIDIQDVSDAIAIIPILEVA